ncbi:Hypothetical protein CpMEX30_2148 [Corynebacterium pseudotuberculosis]|nr:Hypothetical protein Cp4202_2041 [Corynebacterium pseudotuberculosis 42/02-A]AER70036.1 Hypothetical protein Cp106_2006 [Corynebacterium pseudotuberculosis 1/06-A]AEX40558.1 Hypothetical protein Cp3995_2116 [Corynebacterium pseudotuberculosis 3/99-5]AFH52996.1 Hypothetical protein Cp267_2126 [Corynebacterium pseudotuberculosis 267]AIG06288.1 hypothetical protein CPTA_00459 [Corynebacterium pseudotuberculosis]
MSAELLSSLSNSSLSTVVELLKSVTKILSLFTKVTGILS